jgi:hypothetical protein
MNIKIGKIDGKKVRVTPQQQTTINTQTPAGLPNATICKMQVTKMKKANCRKTLHVYHT